MGMAVNSSTKKNSKLNSKLSKANVNKNSKVSQKPKEGSSEHDNDRSKSDSKSVENMDNSSVDENKTTNTLKNTPILSTITLNSFDHNNLQVFCTDKSYRIHLLRCMEDAGDNNYYREEEETIIEKTFPFMIKDFEAKVEEGKLAIKFSKVDENVLTVKSGKGSKKLGDYDKDGEEKQIVVEYVDSKDVSKVDSSKISEEEVSSKLSEKLDKVEDLEEVKKSKTNILKDTKTTDDAAKTTDDAAKTTDDAAKT